jgi:choline transport protein
VTVISGNPIPLNSLIVSFVITVLLSLINIGSTIAFNNIVSLGVAALISSYAISISCLLIRKLRQPKTLPSARWTMGKYGIFVNAISVAYLLLVFIMSFFPQVPSPVPANFNWSIVIYGAVVLWSAAYFMLKGRRVYHGPVVLCRRLD